MATDLKTYVTPEEYLAGERASVDVKHEWIDGELREMNGATRAHNLLTKNLVVAFENRVGDNGFDVYPGDMRVRVPDGPYYYPDVVVAAEPPVFEDGHLDTLRNPLVIAEVLSPSTESIDRGEKLEGYSRVASLRDLLLVSQHSLRIDHYHRESDGENWQLVLATDESVELRFPVVDCRVPLADVYKRVVIVPA